MTIERKDGKYIINRDNDEPIALTCNEVSLLVNFVGKEGLRIQINDRLDEAIENEDINMDAYNGTKEEFVEEVFETFEDDIDYGNSVSDDDIDEEIAQLAGYYDMSI